MAQTHLYEGLILLSQPALAADFGGTIQFLREVFERAEAEVIAMRKWDERRLSYAIKGQKRGTFILTYFRVRGSQIPNIERDFNLSEQVLRSLILRADHLGETELELASKDADLTLETNLQSETSEANPPATESTTAVAEAEAPQAVATVDDEGKASIEPSSNDDNGGDSDTTKPPA